MTILHPADLDSGATDSVPSSPRSDSIPSNQRLHDDIQPRVRFMCSFGGKILPRPHDNHLRYVGGDTRMVAVHRHITFSSLLTKLSKLSGYLNINVKYQLPNEDLDALITVTTDEDVENMIEEYERFVQNNLHSKAARLRLFLFSSDAISRTSSISSLLDGSSKRENWFLDALNGGSGSGLDRGRSEVSSIVSEMPDYLFGLDNSDENPRDSKLKTRFVLHETVSNSDPGSPAPVVSSPFCSTSSSLAPPYVPSITDLPPVNTKPDMPNPIKEPKDVQVENFPDISEQPVSQLTGYPGKPAWHYVPDAHYPGSALQHIPVYYVPGPVPPGNVPVQPLPIQAPYFQHFLPPPGQIPVGFRQSIPGTGQVYGAVPRPVGAMDPYDISAIVVPDAQTVYYGVGNAGVVPTFPGMVVPAGEELPRSGTDGQVGQGFPLS